MKKIVNINAVHPISGVAQIVRGRLTNVTMSTEDIFKCLCARASVTEVIGDTLVPLNFDNYNKNNKPNTEPIVIPTTPVVPTTTKETAVLKDYDKKNEDSTDEVAKEETTTEVADVTKDEDTVDETVAEETTEVEEATTEETAEDESKDEETTSDEAVEETTETSTNYNHYNNNRKKHRK